MSGRFATAVVAWLLAACAGEAPPPPWTRIDLPSLTACGVCHIDVYEEWAASLHHRAWINDNVRAETNGFESAGCRPCHSPLPVLLSGLDRRPRYRDFNQLDGVHCLSCHGLADGVAAARTIADAPCRPRRDERLLDANLCWPCHQPTHHAFDEYEVSKARADGIRCADCHMEAVSRPPLDGVAPPAPRAGRSHGPNGGLNPDFVRRALDWSCRREGGEVIVTLLNLTGHKFPGEIPSRVFQVRLIVDGGEPEHVTLRKPAKSEARADDRLAPDETRELRFPVDVSARAVRVTLLFKPFPLLPDEAAFVIGEWTDGSSRER